MCTYVYDLCISLSPPYIYIPIYLPQELDNIDSMQTIASTE